MDLIRAKKLALASMSNHGLTDNGWAFSYMKKAKRLFGLCCYDEKMLKLSVHLTDLNDEKEVMDTILHEIAHALTPDDAGHGKQWKAKCIEIGARPVRCYGNEVNAPQHKVIYSLECSSCGNTLNKASTGKPNFRCCGQTMIVFDTIFWG